MQLVQFDERVRQAQLARQFGNANAMPFSEWLRRNAPHGMRTGPSAAAPEEEEALLRRRGVRRVGRYRYDFVFSVCITASLAGLALLVFSAMAALYARVDGAMTRMEGAVAPHAATILNSTLEMLSDSRDTMHHLHNTMEHGDVLATETAPRLVESVNSTTAMLKRLEALLAHPVLQVSLEDTP